MKFDNYKRAFNRMLIALDPVCDYYKKKKMYFIWDAFKCHLRYGVTPNEYIGWAFYKKSPLERKEFYTARDEKKYEKKLNDYSKADIFNKKELTLEVFQDFVHRKWIYSPNATPNQIKDFISCGDKFIVKPNELSSGRGIHVLTENDKIEDLIKNNCLIEEFVNQHKTLSLINSSSVNTIRIFSIKTQNNIDLDKWGGVCRKENTIIFSAIIRVGGKDAEVDNYHAGGVAYPIDITTGLIKGEGVNISGRRFAYHPSSGVYMIGFEIPKWKEIQSYIYNLNQVVEGARLIAWDIAVTDDGLDLIEANYEGDPGVMQAPSGIGFKRLIINSL